ncbi:MAG: dehydrogenase [Christensenellaceae bacterium]|jgi:2-oxoisovalerate dehydrogenase E1 component|nr:dehydrogenase [Christensenellaceae bacterium]
MMPKNQFLDPNVLLKPGKIKFNDIDVNTYNKTMLESFTAFSHSELLDIYSQLLTIREFETAIQSIGDTGYHGIKHVHKGPIHLTIGQEAVSVGEANALSLDDIVFGSHRSHGELIAISLAQIKKRSEKELIKIMEEYNNGSILRIVEKKNQGDIKSLSRDFLLYGAMCEILGKTNGFQYGLAGSIHVFFPPFGIYPNNGVVGGSAPFAVGSSLFNHIHKKPGIVVANMGDGALGCGILFESMNFAAMDQFRLLWQEKKGLPLIFSFIDNGYGMGGQTRGETMAYDFLARLGAGISPTQLHSERINGNDPFSVIDAFSRKKQILLDGAGPALLDIVTYRLAGHSISDASTYRTDDEIDAWMSFDPLIVYPQNLVRSKLSSQDEINEIKNKVVEVMIKNCQLASDEKVSPFFSMTDANAHYERVLFSDNEIKTQRSQQVERLKNSRENALSNKSRMQITISDALYEAISYAFSREDSLISYGEDVREWGGVGGVYSGLNESLAYERLFNSPISEAAIVSVAIGYAFKGGRVLVEIMFADFLARAGDEIINQLAKWQSLSGGFFKLPIVIRTSVGSEYGAQHAQDLLSVVASIPGLKVVFPVTPYDCKGLLNRALAGSDPVIFFESRKLYGKTEQFIKNGVPDEYYEIDFGEPDIKSSGSDVTILTIGAVLYTALEASKILLDQYKISVEIIDARSIVPFNYAIVIKSIKKTGCIIVAGDSCDRNSVMKNFATDIVEQCFFTLRKAPIVISSKNTLTPHGEYYAAFYPQVEDFVKAVLSLKDN